MLKTLLAEMKERHSAKSLRDQFVWWLSQNRYIDEYRDFIQTLNIGEMTAKVRYDSNEKAVIIEPQNDKHKLVEVVDEWLNSSGFKVVNQGPAITTYRDGAGNQVFYDPRTGVVQIEGYTSE